MMWGTMRSNCGSRRGKYFSGNWGELLRHHRGSAEWIATLHAGFSSRGAPTGRHGWFRYHRQCASLSLKGPTKRVAVEMAEPRESERARRGTGVKASVSFLWQRTPMFLLRQVSIRWGESGHARSFASAGGEWRGRRGRIARTFRVAPCGRSNCASTRVVPQFQVLRLSGAGGGRVLQWWSRRGALRPCATFRWISAKRSSSGLPARFGTPHTEVSGARGCYSRNAVVSVFIGIPD